MNNAVNTFIIGLLGMLIRQWILTLIGAMGLAPLIKPYLDANMTQFTQFSLSIAGGLIVVGYALKKRFFDKQKLVQALSEASLSEREVEIMVKNKLVSTPSVLTPKSEVPS